MDPIPPTIWIAAVAHHLQLHWRTVDPRELEATARELLHDSELSQLPPAQAVESWLKPMAEAPAAGHHRG